MLALKIIGPFYTPNSGFFVFFLKSSVIGSREKILQKQDSWRLADSVLFIQNYDLWKLNALEILFINFSYLY